MYIVRLFSPGLAIHASLKNVLNHSIFLQTIKFYTFFSKLTQSRVRVYAFLSLELFFALICINVFLSMPILNFISQTLKETSLCYYGISFHSFIIRYSESKEKEHIPYLLHKHISISI